MNRPDTIHASVYGAVSWLTERQQRNPQDGRHALIVVVS